MDNVNCINISEIIFNVNNAIFNLINNKKLSLIIIIIISLKIKITLKCSKNKKNSDIHTLKTN